MRRWQFVTLLGLLAPLSSCSRSSTASSAPGKEFRTTNGSIVRLGAVVVDGTNVPLTNVQVK